MAGTQTLSAGFLDVKRTLAQTIRKKIAGEKISIAEVARRMGTGRSAVYRLLDDDNMSITLQTMETAAAIMGLRVRTEINELSPKELGKLAGRLATATSKQEGRKLRQQIMDGFYGARTSA